MGCRSVSPFEQERARPFFDLIGQIPSGEIRTVVDLGCGPGDLTATLTRRWPRAIVVGVDSSGEMLARARTHEVESRLTFQKADLTQWKPSAPVDVLVSNAALHWAPDHSQLIPRLVSFLAPFGVLAVQMPNRFRDPAQMAIESAVASGPWALRLKGIGLHAESVLPTATYVELLRSAGCEVNAWETTYFHVLPGPDGALDWLKGTGLRPLLVRLEPAEHDAFLQDLGARLRAAYPPAHGATVFPMRRTFFVGRRNPKVG